MPQVRNQAPNDVVEVQVQDRAQALDAPPNVGQVNAIRVQGVAEQQREAQGQDDTDSIIDGLTWSACDQKR